MSNFLRVLAAVLLVAMVNVAGFLAACGPYLAGRG